MYYVIKKLRILHQFQKKSAKSCQFYHSTSKEVFLHFKISKKVLCRPN